MRLFPRTAFSFHLKVNASGDPVTSRDRTPGASPLCRRSQVHHAGLIAVCRCVPTTIQWHLTPKRPLVERLSAELLGDHFETVLRPPSSRSRSRAEPQQASRRRSGEESSQENNAGRSRAEAGCLSVDRLAQRGRPCVKSPAQDSPRATLEDWSPATGGHPSAERGEIGRRESGSAAPSAGPEGGVAAGTAGQQNTCSDRPGPRNRAATTATVLRRRARWTGSDTLLLPEPAAVRAARSMSPTPD